METEHIGGSKMKRGMILLAFLVIFSIITTVALAEDNSDDATPHLYFTDLSPVPESITASGGQVLMLMKTSTAIAYGKQITVVNIVPKYLRETAYGNTVPQGGANICVDKTCFFLNRSVKAVIDGTFLVYITDMKDDGTDVTLKINNLVTPTYPKYKGFAQSGAYPGPTNNTPTYFDLPEIDLRTVSAQYLYLLQYDTVIVTGHQLSVQNINNFGAMICVEKECVRMEQGDRKLFGDLLVYVYEIPSDMMNVKMQAYLVPTETIQQHENALGEGKVGSNNQFTPQDQTGSMKTLQLMRTSWAIVFGKEVLVKDIMCKDVGMYGAIICVDQNCTMYPNGAKQVTNDLLIAIRRIRDDCSDVLMDVYQVQKGYQIPTGEGVDNGPNNYIQPTTTTPTQTASIQDIQKSISDLEKENIIEEEKKAEVIVQKVASCTAGCLVNGECLTVGARTMLEQHNFYCSTDNTIKAQKESKTACVNAYECLDNMCTYNTCGYKGKFQKMVGWLKLKLGNYF